MCWPLILVYLVLSPPAAARALRAPPGRHLFAAGAPLGRRGATLHSRVTAVTQAHKDDEEMRFARRPPCAARAARRQDFSRYSKYRALRAAGLTHDEPKEESAWLVAAGGRSPAGKGRLGSAVMPRIFGRFSRSIPHCTPHHG